MPVTKKAKSRAKAPAVEPTQVVVNPPIPKPSSDGNDALAETVSKIFARYRRTL